MTRTASTRTLGVILIGTLLVVAGNGLLQTMLPLRGALEGFSTALIGLQGTAYFGGFVIGCLFGPRLIRDVGHIRAFAGVVSALAVTILVLPLWVDAWGWVILRGLSGISLSVIFMALESWLNDQATNETRGRVLSAYVILSNLGWIAGQLAVNLADLAGMTLFLLAVMAIALAVAPVSLTLSEEPTPIPSAKLDLKGLFAISTVGTLGCFLVGVTEGALWSLGPIFGQEKGLPIAEVTLMMGALVLGGTLTQWPLGKLSDNHDRRLVILPVVLATIVSGFTLASVGQTGPWTTILMAGIHGAMMIPIYPLCIAHVNDATPSDKFVQVASGLLLVYASGAALGPLIAGPMMARFGPGGLFLFIALVLILFALVIVWRILAIRRARPFAVPYIWAPRTTQSLYDTDDEETAD